MKNAKKPAELPTRVFAQAILPTRSRIPLYSKERLLRTRDVSDFYADEDAVEKAKERLEKEGFRVRHTRPGKPRKATNDAAGEGYLPTLSIAGQPRLFREALQTNLGILEIRRRTSGKKWRDSTHLIFEEEGTSYIAARGALVGVVEGVALAAPARLFEVLSTPPPREYFHLELPRDLENRLRANVAHNAGFTGQGIRVAMVDTGHFKHPFFAAHHYKCEDVVLAASATDPNRDENGHGTGESANLFAVAPKVTLIPVKAPLAGAEEGGIREALIDAADAFQVAAELDPPPHIITCSWGYDLTNRNDLLNFDARALEVAVVDALARGIVVVFAAGNDGDRGFPAQHPEVIAVGGAYMSKQGELQASGQASAFRSKIYKKRGVPDVCGLIGLAHDDDRYLMLPVPPGSMLDRALRQSGDETKADDGWAAFSGTSAAAPQVAGVIALMLQANPNLTPEGVKHILKKSARDVTQGKAASTGGKRPEAKTGVDLATGAGLVDAAAAVQEALNSN